MDDLMFRRDDPRDPEIEHLLDAFAELRLSPSLAATTRMRAGVMAVAHRRAALLQADATTAALGSIGATASGVSGTPAALRSAARVGSQGRARWRRPVAALLAATLTLGVLAGTVAASSAGGPLYATRIWIETVNLPRDVLARAQAEVVRLDRRVQEAIDASAAGDTEATEAALDAYSTILAVATSETGGDPTATSTLDASVAQHIAVLTALGATVPAAARPAIEHALASSAKALHDLEQPGATPPGSNDGQGGPGTPAGPGTSGGAGATADPGTQGGPASPGAGPDKTPGPPTNVDKSTPRPDRTPKPDQRDPKASPTHPVPSRRQ
jgi:hypothetical protein